MRTKLRLLEIVVIALPILVAAVQITLYKSSNLSSWRGGGFGMYSDPHPRASRSVFLSGVRETSRITVRIYPLDERLGFNDMRNTLFMRNLEALQRAARAHRNFPAGTLSAELRARLERVFKEHPAEPLVLSLFPVGSLQLVVTSVEIADDYRHMTTRVLAERKL
jgi:hypothetical protein